MNFRLIAPSLAFLILVTAQTAIAQVPSFNSQQVQPLAGGEKLVLGRSVTPDTLYTKHALWGMDSTAYQLLRYSAEGELIQDYPLDKLFANGRSLRFGYLHNLNMHMVDSATFYLYGEEMGYGFFPFVFRSTDAGQHWERVLFVTNDEILDRMDFRMVENSLVMFDSLHGVLMQAQVGKGDKLHLKILETKDGWKTTRERKIQLADLPASFLNKLEYSFLLNKEIEIMAVGHPDTLVFRSVDQAATFQPTIIKEIVD